ncbi:protein MpGT61.2 [Marchantia polymorpha subsp. ruderalis]|nr:hypothetical protein MARPO_0015s0106 [Marchantia polymorpha]BBN01539.1 hypothetical protein Mp_2g08210 [Marchantia polymorpha subsp. ruderalis]|eukprot:PTQ45308.1 hypothetical protein MARPO_0015s0106 [Marchantia polymorpha]
MDVRRRQERELQREAPSASAPASASEGDGVGLVSLQVSGAMTYGLERSRSARRRGGKLGFRLRKACLCVFFSGVFCFSILQWLLSFPPPLHKRPLVNACPSTTGVDTPYLLYDDAVCSRACGNQCFPRVRGMCIAHSEVAICDQSDRLGGRGRGKTRTPIPSHLRFAGADPMTRRRVPIRRKACSGDFRDKKWIRGTQMVADMKMMPAGPHVGPNPHHEAEKIVPAILLSHLYGLNNSSLYWFTDPVPSITSRWSIGLIAAFADGLEVKFMDAPDAGEPEVCFEDAILFSGVTNAGYMPTVAANDWLRRKVLAHCKIPEVNAKRPVKDVVVIQRNNSSRTIANAEEIERVLERELRVPVKHTVSGLGNFCEQAKLVAEADFFVTPHGSHNINFLFARPDSIILEAFPLLYYIDWFHNYVHASRVNHYELYGTWPTDQGGMPLRMRIYALFVGWRLRINFAFLRESQEHLVIRAVFVLTLSCASRIVILQLHWISDVRHTRCNSLFKQLGPVTR